MKIEAMRGESGLARCVLALGLCVVLFGVAGCDKQATDTANANTGAIDKSRVKRGVKPEPDAEVAVLETAYGRIVIELYPNIAPKMVERYKQLVREGFYDNTAFHRIDTKQYGIIQGGDPLTKDNDPANDGSGDSQYPNVPAELSDVPFDAGIVGAARRDIDTANSQFYIQVKPFPDFNEQYTVFGRVIQGLDNARVIMTAPLEEGREDRPADPVRITRATLAPRAEFAKSGAVK